MTQSPLTGRYTAFHRDAAGKIAPLPPDHASIQAALRDTDGLVWIDLQVAVPDDARILSEVFQFHELSIDDVINDRIDPAKIDDHGDYLFIVVQGLTGFDTEHELQVLEADFYLGSNYVVSCHHECPATIAHALESPQRVAQLMHKSAAWLLQGLLDGIVDDYLPIVDALDEKIDQLENDILDRPDQKLLQQILTAKRNSIRLRRATTPQRDIMNRLSRGEYPALIPAETSMYFRDVYDHLVRVEYLIEALRDLSDGTLQTYLSVVSNKMNEVMRVLTVAATIFLPLTLVVGLYGTNFSHNIWPSYDSAWGFPVSVVFMFVIAVGMLVYFRYRRWI